MLHWGVYSAPQGAIVEAVSSRGRPIGAFIQLGDASPLAGLDIDHPWGLVFRHSGDISSFAGMKFDLRGGVSKRLMLPSLDGKEGA